jgi:glutathione synthase/RimK-type ligase-like ATP-grasp enzyme
MRGSDKKIVLCGSPNDAHVAALAETLTAQGIEPFILDAQRFPESMKISLGASGADIFVDGERMAEPAAVYLRSLYQDPAGFGVDVEADMASDWRRTMMVFRERATLLSSIVLRWDEAGVPIYNPPSSRANITKPFQLSLLAAAGLPVPITTWTNDPARVRAFCREYEAVYKPVAGGAATRRITQADLGDARLATLARSPVCFQELLPGDDIRVFVIDGRVEVALRIVTDAIDFRQNEQRVEMIDLPADVAAQCVRATEVLGLRWTGMDLKADRHGVQKILELNPSAMFLGFDARSGSDVRAALASALMRHLD